MVELSSAFRLTFGDHTSQSIPSDVDTEIPEYHKSDSVNLDNVLPLISTGSPLLRARTLHYDIHLTRSLRRELLALVHRPWYLYMIRFRLELRRSSVVNRHVDRI